eukprot:CAMPEP_0116039078 /NCGR_PEP_ID=MMETSP0321-20121206/23282_1 /TAXON_ID=163516 /ORGANISM="Leptocylindrus danicus var. danicus, Strain B650" /LENGTH=759 /DNA_ID=CAMNT_0003518099 /DNA_START=9 /DNA_END=2288 /DNA_ORIENTATION=+
MPRTAIPRNMLTLAPRGGGIAGNAAAAAADDGNAVVVASQKLDKLADVAAAATAASSDTSTATAVRRRIPGDYRGNKIAKIELEAEADADAVAVADAVASPDKQTQPSIPKLDEPGSYTLALREPPLPGVRLRKRKSMNGDYRGNKLGGLDEKEIDLLRDASWSKREKKLWTVDEDLMLKRTIAEQGLGNWSDIAHQLNLAGSHRSGKQCRERWHNHLDPDVKKGCWSTYDDELILKLQAAYGNRWAKIAEFIPGRTDNAVKNRFHTIQRIKKKEDERKNAIDRALARNIKPGDPYPAIEGATVTYPNKESEKDEVVDKIIEILRDGDISCDESSDAEGEEADDGNEGGDSKEVGPYTALLEEVAKKDRVMELRKNRALHELKRARQLKRAEEKLKKAATAYAKAEAEAAADKGDTQIAERRPSILTSPISKVNFQKPSGLASENLEDPQIRGTWTRVEDDMIIQLHERFGNRWVQIAENIPGRTDNAVKNRYHIVRRRRGIPLPVRRKKKRRKSNVDEKSKRQKGELLSPAKRLYPLPTFISPSSSRKGKAKKNKKPDDKHGKITEDEGKIGFQEYVPPNMAGFLDDDNARMYFGLTNEGIIDDGYWNKEDEQSACILGGIISCYAKKLEDQVRINPLIGRCGFCRKFGDETTKLVCDGEDCKEEYHMECLKPALKEVPEGEWLCPKCANPPKMPTVQVNEAPSTNCSTCDKGGDDLIPCDGCPKLFHMECLPEGPSKEALFNDEFPWYCPACTSPPK